MRNDIIKIIKLFFKNYTVLSIFENKDFYVVSLGPRNIDDINVINENIKSIKKDTFEIKSVSSVVNSDLMKTSYENVIYSNDIIK